MIHKITIEIESEKIWAAICAISSLTEKPISELAKTDVITSTKIMAKGIKDDPGLMIALDKMQPENKKRILAILN